MCTKVRQEDSGGAGLMTESQDTSYSPEVGVVGGF